MRGRRAFIAFSLFVLSICAFSGRISQGGTLASHPADKEIGHSQPDCSAANNVYANCHCRQAAITPKLVVHNSNDPKDVLQFNAWLHRSADAIQLFGGRADWSDWKNSLDWMATLFNSAPIDIMWSVPLIPLGASLEAAAQGDYNQRYSELAQQFIGHYGSTKKINIRLGWEFNGKGWTPWSAVGKAAQYKAAYREFVKAFRDVASNFVFEWTPNIGDVGMNPELAYPGDDVVDIVGLDFYYNTAWDPHDPIQAWNYFVSEKYGLQWHQDFAAAHHKVTAYAEWGVNSDAAGPFILQAAKWFSSHGIVYHSYWNSNADFAGRLSDNQYPNAGAAYRSAFGASSSASGAASGVDCPKP